MQIWKSPSNPKNSKGIISYSWSLYFSESWLIFNIFYCSTISRIAGVHISKSKRLNLWHIVFYWKAKTSTGLHIYTADVLSINGCWKYSPWSVPFFGYWWQHQSIERTVWLTFHKFITIWLRMISKINKDVSWQFKMWKISFVKIMLQWHQETLMFLLVSVFILTPSPYTHTHQKIPLNTHTLKIPLPPKKLLHAKKTFPLVKYLC